jgi:hypothetical protein
MLCPDPLSPAVHHSSVCKSITRARAGRGPNTSAGPLRDYAPPVRPPGPRGVRLPALPQPCGPRSGKRPAGHVPANALRATFRQTPCGPRSGKHPAGHVPANALRATFRQTPCGPRSSKRGCAAPVARRPSWVCAAPVTELGPAAGQVRRRRGACGLGPVVSSRTRPSGSVTRAGPWMSCTSQTHAPHASRHMQMAKPGPVRKCLPCEKPFARAHSCGAARPLGYERSRGCKVDEPNRGARKERGWGETPRSTFRWCCVVMMGEAWRDGMRSQQ